MKKSDVFQVENVLFGKSFAVVCVHCRYRKTKSSVSWQSSKSNSCSMSACHGCQWHGCYSATVPSWPHYWGMVPEREGHSPPHPPANISERRLPFSWGYSRDPGGSSGQTSGDCWASQEGATRADRRRYLWRNLIANPNIVSHIWWDICSLEGTPNAGTKGFSR